jgi:hypothetical protein
MIVHDKCIMAEKTKRSDFYMRVGRQRGTVIYESVRPNFNAPSAVGIKFDRCYCSAERHAFPEYDITGAEYFGGPLQSHRKWSCCAVSQAQLCVDYSKQFTRAS